MTNLIVGYNIRTAMVLRQVVVENGNSCFPFSHGNTNDHGVVRERELPYGNRDGNGSGCESQTQQPRPPASASRCSVLSSVQTIKLQTVLSHVSVIRAIIHRPTVFKDAADAVQ